VLEDTKDKRADFTGQSIQSHHFALVTAQCATTLCHLKHRFPMAGERNAFVLCISSSEGAWRQHGGALHVSLQANLPESSLNATNLPS